MAPFSARLGDARRQGLSTAQRLTILVRDILKDREHEFMASLDWSECPVVESIPGKVSGAWVLRGTRTPVKVLFENLEAGMSIEEVIEQFPVNREQIDSLMAFVARSLDRAPTYR